MLRWIAALSAGFSMVHAAIFLAIGTSHWREALVVTAACMVVLLTARPCDSFARMICGLMLFVVVVTWVMCDLVLTFGRDSGFHFPLLICLPVIAISGRLGSISKQILSTAFVVALLMFDRVSAPASGRMAMDDEFTMLARLLNIGFVAIALYGVVSRHFAIVVRQKAELTALSTTDALTGLLNRRHLTDVAIAQIAIARRHDRPLSLLICDIDDFKAINDRHGHHGGDAVIRHVAEAISGSLRVSDQPGRWGGEEFVVVLPDTGQDDAHVVAERIVRQVMAQAVPMLGRSVSVTITAGVATLRDGDTFEEVLRRADTALYAGKAAGKNQVNDDPSCAARDERVCG